MTPVRINIVYKNNNMPADVLPEINVPTAKATVVWSRIPQPNSDAVVYFNHYTYDRKLHDKVAPKALRLLYMYEPVAVDPVQYTRFDIAFGKFPRRGINKTFIYTKVWTFLYLQCFQRFRFFDFFAF